MPPPLDSDLHREATSPAKVVVNKYSEPQPLKLYAGWFYPLGLFHVSPSRTVLQTSLVQRVWTVLEETRIPCQYTEINPYHTHESPGTYPERLRSNTSV